MAVKGTGTESDPWEVSTYAEMVEYLSKSRTTDDGEVYGDNWVRLIADINCNEACPEGWTTVNMANNLDMYGHKIIAPLVKNENKLFLTFYNVFLMNGHILNVYENFTSVGSFFANSSAGSKIKVENMQIDFNLRNNNVSFGYATSIKNCRISISGNFSPQYYFFNDGNTEIDSNIFELNYKSSNVSKRLFADYYTKKQINNCLFTGEVDNFNLCSSYNEGSSGGSSNSGSFVNCIIAVKTDETETNYRYYVYGNNLVSSETKGMTFNTNYGGTIETLTDAQLKSLTAVQATQFYVATPPTNTTSGGT